ncbi:hypothetical protein D9O40_20540 [Clostridium autoethanogenum]|uniref:Peptide O-xylosyltransferase n=1 Tax=Clostridium autoethanogenum TaxID=84023 RepID=A0A3M0SCE7_9CLOT|nr:beta-1,6-N-acetylglucosaminyltransferase [Clostridium autoethanogenum]RMC92317.1 hypothetical protein D9O40_20540 [Clostridium autoethanogenum]
MRHAYLIIAHNNWMQLKLLIQLLDNRNNDIYIHIDRKAYGYNIEELENLTLYSNVKVYSVFKNYWGSYNLVKIEIFLLNKAIKCNYSYYHLFSGMDLPIKSQRYIQKFFEKNKGKEFIHFVTDIRLNTDIEIWRRSA